MAVGAVVLLPSSESVRHHDLQRGRVQGNNNDADSGGRLMPGRSRVRTWHAGQQDATGPKTVPEFATQMKESNRKSTGDALDLAQESLDILKGRLMRLAEKVLYGGASSSVGSVSGEGMGSRIPDKVAALGTIQEISEGLQALVRQVSS
jgi:hypothetical protein